METLPQATGIRGSIAWDGRSSANSTGVPPKSLAEHVLSVRCRGTFVSVLISEMTSQAMRVREPSGKKAETIHVSCIQGRFQNTNRFARHGSHVICLNAAGSVDSVITKTEPVKKMAAHKTIFIEKKFNANRWTVMILSRTILSAPHLRQQCFLQVAHRLALHDRRGLNA